MTKKHKCIRYGTCINESAGTRHVAYDAESGQCTFAVPFIDKAVFAKLIADNKLPAGDVAG
jgi:hypothetical protein